MRAEIKSRSCRKYPRIRFTDRRFDYAATWYLWPGLERDILVLIFERVVGNSWSEYGSEENLMHCDMPIT